MSEPPEPPPLAGADVYALLSDGTTVLVRPAAASDFAAVKAMHEAMSPANAYLRFFSLSRSAPEREARRICRAPGPDHAALLALLSDHVVGVASYEVEAGTTTAEIAFAVAETMHHRGIATLLLEHLVSRARARGLTAFTAEALSENTSMLRVFNDAGLPTHSRREQGTVAITIPLPPGGAPDPGNELAEYLDTVALRERSASVASLRPVFAPRSVAVIGASRRQGTVGRSVLDNIVAGGYRGTLYAVNPHATEIGGVACFPSASGLPAAPDLALIALPPQEVLRAAQECGVLGVKGLVVLTAGLNAAESAGLLDICRRHGMRLLGPNCFGIAVPAIGLEATFAATSPVPGTAGLVMQSGGLGLAMVEHLSRLGIGISSFASVGNKLDVSSNDMLMWWEQDDVTTLAVLYIESFGHPRKFARTARRVGQRMPVLTVHAATSEAGQQAAASHTAAVATPLVTREALFEQAGIIATPSFGELLETTALLATTPPPGGRTVSIVSNVGGAGVLAADACTDLGLTVHHPGSQTRRRIREFAPEGGSVAGPVDTTATVTCEDFRQVLELISADEGTDAIIVLVLPTAATGDLVGAICDASVSVPMVAVVLDQPEAVRLLTARSGQVPAYGYPEAAAAALARAATYGEWRARRPGDVPVFPGTDQAAARELIRGFLSASPDGGWLSLEDTAAVLRWYGIPVTDSEAAARRLAAGGTEVIVRVEDDQMFGPLVVFGRGGATPDPGGRAARLAPLTETDADAMLGSIRPGARADLAALRDLLLRVSRMSDDLPEIAELDLSPLIAGPDGVSVAGARVRVAPQAPQDPFLRRLRLRYVTKTVRRGAAMTTGSGHPTSSVPGPRTAPGPAPLTAAELDAIDAWWRAANYLSVGQIYLLDNVACRARDPGIDPRGRRARLRPRARVRRPTLIASSGPVDAVGHRVVHGGTLYAAPVRVTSVVRRKLESLTDLAPLHQPKSLAALDAVGKILPDVPAVACFDTAFHATIPEAAATFALPLEWRARWTLRRYGFHGLSHAYAARRVAELLGPDSSRAGLRVVNCHLGAGASLAAIRDGRSVDTTMGFTPLDGLVMATRSGSVDPGLVLWLEKHAGTPPAELGAALEYRSGLAGLAGTPDMREVLSRAAGGDSRPLPA